MKADGDPNLIVYFGGQYMPLREARVGILTHALHYGTGVFEGIRAHWDEPAQELFVMRPQEHYERWKQNCGILRIDVPMSPEELCGITVELMRRNGFRTNVYVRPLAYKSAERIGVATDDQDAFAIIALPFGDYLHAEKGLHAGVSSWRRIEDNAIPARAKICGAYVNSALASDEVRRNGFDEAIFLNESGHVAEGATCNIFMVRKGKLITPPVTDNVLEGITRDSIMELAQRELGLQVVERPIDRSELYHVRRVVPHRNCGWHRADRARRSSAGQGWRNRPDLRASCSSSISMQRADICRLTGSGCSGLPGAAAGESDAVQLAETSVA